MEKSWAIQMYGSAQKTVEEIKSNAIDRKLFNFITNDLQGFLKNTNNPLFSFDYYGMLLHNEVVDFLVATLQKANFEEERYDKKYIKEEIVQFLNKQEIPEDTPIKFKKIFFDWNEQQVELFYKIKQKL